MGRGSTARVRRAVLQWQPSHESTGFVTPHTFEDWVPKEKYRLGLFLKNYRFIKSDIEASGGGETQNFFIQIPIDYGSLTIDSLPRGAEIFLNGKLTGTTPLTLDRLLPDTLFSVELRLSKHHPFTREVKIVAGKKETLNAQLVRE